jgi:hypothetical protein
MRLRRRFLFALLAAAAMPAALMPTPAAAATWTPVASGLDSPRGIAFVDGRMLVTESGHGSAADCFFGGPAAGNVCIGPSGRISWITNGVRTTLVDGLFSQKARGGFDTEGPSGLSIEEGRILVQISGTPQEVPPPPPLSAAAYALGQAQSGHLISVRTDGTWNSVAQVGRVDFDYTATLPPSAGQEVDSNPTGVLATEEGAYVADSGSNTLDRIGEDGQVRILFRDPWLAPNPATAFPHDAVPTCVVKTEDGLLVGELSGRVLKVHGTSFSVISNSLFTHITGCTSDRHGNVYFVNMFGGGAPFSPSFFMGNVVKYDVESGQATTLVSAPFLLPYGDTIGPDGNLYVTVRSICPTLPQCSGATGGVIKISLPHNEVGD